MADSYSDLVGRVVALLGRGNVRPLVPGWIQMVEAEAVHRIRDLREVIYKISGNLTSGTAELTLPDGCTGVTVFQLDESPTMIVDPVTLPEMAKRRSGYTSGSDVFPRVWAFTGQLTVELAPTPSANTAYTLYYTANMADVTELKYTSQVLEEAPNMLYYGAACHGARWNRDANALAIWEPEYQKALGFYEIFIARKDPELIQVASYSQTRDWPMMTGTH
jgi:hypothetical protein